MVSRAARHIDQLPSLVPAHYTATQQVMLHHIRPEVSVALGPSTTSTADMSSILWLSFDAQRGTFRRAAVQWGGGHWQLQLLKTAVVNFAHDISNNKQR